MDVHSGRVLRLEVVETGRRRRFTQAEKLRIVEESQRGNRQASSAARRPGISNTLLFRWRKAYRKGRLTGEGGPCSFPALLVDSAGSGPAPSEAKTSRMEIIAHGGRRVIVDADVDVAALARVLEVLEGQ